MDKNTETTVFITLSVFYYAIVFFSAAVIWYLFANNQDPGIFYTVILCADGAALLLPLICIKNKSVGEILMILIAMILLILFKDWLFLSSNEIFSFVSNQIVNFFKK